MKKTKYILIIVVLGIIAFVGWNQIGTSVKDKELYLVYFIASEMEFYPRYIEEAKKIISSLTFL